MKEEILTQPNHLKKELIKSTSTSKNQNKVDPVTGGDNNEKKNDNDETTVHVHEEKERLLSHDAVDASIANNTSDQEFNVIMLLATVIVAMIC